MLEITKKICQEYDIKPARNRGQSFLIAKEAYDAIIKAAEIRPDDIVMEVGPGLGFLTIGLSRQARQVVAIELDKQLAKVLQTRIRKEKIASIKLIQDDILDIDNDQGCPGYPGRPYKIVANLPYNISSVFLRNFLSQGRRPKSMTLMLQKEVADRIVAKPGKMSLLSISVQYYTEPKIITDIPREMFWPVPQVDSSIIHLTVKSKLPIRGVDKEKDFFRLAKFGFAQKRKMLKNNLAAGYQIEQKQAEKLIESAGLNPKARAQDLSMTEWLNLFGVIRGNVL